jgi:hypothetical protein
MNYKILFLPVAAIFNLIIIGCSDPSINQGAEPNNEASASSRTPELPDTGVIKIYVAYNGKISADGNEVSLKQLDSLLKYIKTQNGKVFYSRFNSQQYEGPKESLAVVNLVIKYNLPLKFYTDSTFTEPAIIN